MKELYDGYIIACRIGLKVDLDITPFTNMVWLSLEHDK